MPSFSVKLLSKTLRFSRSALVTHQTRRKNQTSPSQFAETWFPGSVLMETLKMCPLTAPNALKHF